MISNTIKYFFYFIIILITLDCYSNPKNFDSSDLNLTFEFGKRNLHCYDVFQDGNGPFNNNKIISSSTLLNKRLMSYKKYYLNGSIGLNYRSYTCSYNSNTMILPNINSNISSNVNMFGLQNAISLGRKILKGKKISLDLQIGISSTGIISSQNRTNSYTFNQTQSFGKDSVLLKFRSNNNFYLNEFIDLSVSNNTHKLAFGLKYLSKSSVSTTNINYEIIDTRAPTGYYLYKGFFLDHYRMFELYLEYKL